MISRHHKAVHWLLIAVVSVLATGNTAVHRLISWHHCGCSVDHSHTDLTPASCGCGHDERPLQPQSTNPPVVADHSDCQIADFYRQPVQTLHQTEFLSSVNLVDFLLIADNSVHHFAPLPAFWSRGPPVSA